MPVIFSRSAEGNINMGKCAGRVNYLILSLCVLCLLCRLCNNEKKENFQTDFPLEPEVVSNALEKTGLAGEISESESSAQGKGYSQYVIRRNIEEHKAIESSEFIANISTLERKDGRILYAVFNQGNVSNQIEWEKWKKQILFATLLYGGFEDEKDVYQAFYGRELPDGKTSFRWDAQLSGGYCVVTYCLRSNSIYDENNFAVKNQSAFLWVDFYESYELYQKIKEK